MDMLRHVAKIANTDQRCVVAFMQIPGREDHALVIPIDNLPPRMEQAVMEVLNTPEGQNEETFAIALSRRLLPDNGQNILEALHKSGRLAAVPVANVLMMPQPNRPIKLSTVLESLNRLPDRQTQDTDPGFKFNPHLNNQQANNAEQNRNIARNLLISAEMMEADAKRKREQAYTYDASLKPTKLGDYTPTDVVLPTELGSQITWPPDGSIPPADVALPLEGAQASPEGPDLMALMTKILHRIDSQDLVLKELQSTKLVKRQIETPIKVTRRRTNNTE